MDKEEPELSDEELKILEGRECLKTSGKTSADDEVSLFSAIGLITLLAEFFCFSRIRLYYAIRLGLEKALDKETETV